MTVQDTLFLPNGTKYSGQLTISWPVPFTGGDGNQIPSGPPISTSVINGALSVPLEANSTATPTGTFYTVTYRPAGSAAINETWIVPCCTTPVNLSAVRVAQPPSPSFMIAPSQISQDSATLGECMVWGGGLAWAPGSCGSVSGPAGGVLTGTYPNPGLANTTVTGSSCGDTTHSCGLAYGPDGRLTGATNNLITSSASSNWLALSNNPFFDTRVYNFTPYSPSGTLTASTPATITVTPCPMGFATSNYSLLVAGTGTPEAVVISNTSTCTSGGSTGTIVFTPAGNHSAGWTLASANVGIQEAVNVATVGGIVKAPAATYNVYASIYIAKTIHFTGDGKNATILVPEIAGMTVFHLVGVNAAILENFSTQYGTLQTFGSTINLDGTFDTLIQNNYFLNGWNEIFMPNGSGSGSDNIQNNTFAAWGHDAITIYSSTPDATGPAIAYNQFTAGSTARAAITHVASGGVTIIGNGFHNNSPYAYFGANTTSSSQVQFLGNQCDGQITACFYSSPGVTFTGYTITGNFISNFLSTAYVGIYIASTNCVGGVISGNFISPYASGAGSSNAGIIADGTDWVVTGNHILHSDTGIQANAGVNISVLPNYLIDVTTPVFFNGGTNIQMKFPTSMTYAQMTAAGSVVADSEVYCSNCTSSCVPTGSGSTCFYNGSTWAH